jgi:hypothetical protein
LFSSATRGIGSGITAAINFVFFFVSVKTFPALIDLLSIELTFFLYGILVQVGSIALYFYMIESKNKTLQEIEEELKKN